MANRDAARVAQAIRFLDEHYREQPSLDDLAHAVGLSPFHFQRLFKRWAGVTPKRFLQFLTVEHAKAALADGQSTLEASWDAGLSGPGRLHDLFLSVEAVTPGEYKQRGDGMTIKYGFADSPFGSVLVALTDRGICGLTFVDGHRDRNALVGLKRRWCGADFREDRAAVREIAARIFTRQDPGRFHLALRGTNFQIKVWEALLRIPSGALVSYGDVARTIGHPHAQRAVGTAVGQNPISYLIPCHRVIKSTGVFGNYAGGATRKKAIIGWEAARRTA
jgi:AraC family transcriptional regulator of adaptative response/methylated-DNA-[protein]-cysteine methyltransferase